MNKKTIAKGIGISFIIFFLFIAFGVFTYHYGSYSDSPGSPNPEHPMLYSPVKKIFIETPVLIRAMGLEINDSYAVQYSRTDSFHHNWTALGTEYYIALKFEYKHKIGDYVFLYLYTNEQIIDTLSFQIEEVNG